MNDTLADRHVLVTGSNTGIGRVTAEVLARRGAKVTLACRSEERTKPVLEAIAAFGGKAEFLALDLGDLASVRAAAKTVLDRGEPLHLLVNNAGLAGAHGVTKDGFELAFGTNHLGHFLLTQLLLPRLRASAPARIVNVSSKSHFKAKEIVWSDLQKPTKLGTGMNEYSVSKLCNILFTKELARRNAGDGVTSYALHPGVIATEIWRSIPRLFRPLVTAFMKSTEQGAETTLYCACSPVVEDESGLYYDECRATSPSEVALDADLARELWTRSEAWVAARD